MRSVLILTISGRDRAGLVEQLATVIADHGGNWEICRMAHLAGRFVGLLELSALSDRQQDLEVELRTIKGLDVMIAYGDVVSADSLQYFDLELLGTDHPGIVRDVFSALAEATVNVEELTTRTLSAPDSGVMLFEARAKLSCAEGLDREQIRQQLERIAQDVMVDIRLSD